MNRPIKQVCSFLILCAAIVSLSVPAPVYAAIDGSPSSLISSSEAKDGWIKEGNQWYYYRNNIPVTGWLQEKNTWYYLNADGTMKTGWLKDKEKWYYLDAGGAMKTGWLQWNGKWYYLLPQNGSMVTGTYTINGKSNLFDNSGVWKNEIAATSPSGGIKSILNNATLTPQYTVSDRLNRDIDTLLQKIITDDMDTYTKVRTVFDYMIQNYKYHQIIYYLNSDDQELQELYLSGGVNEYMAIKILESGEGICDNYSAAFAAIMRAIGLDCRFVYGLSYTTSGSSSPHAWTVIVIDGIEYVFDPQIEQNIAQTSGKVNYYRFGVTYSSIPNRYSVTDQRPFLS